MTYSDMNIHKQIVQFFCHLRVVKDRPISCPPDFLVFLCDIMYLVKSFFIVYKRLAEANEQLDVLNLDDQQCLNNESWEMVLH